MVPLSAMKDGTRFTDVHERRTWVDTCPPRPCPGCGRDSVHQIHAKLIRHDLTIGYAVSCMRCEHCYDMPHAVRHIRDTDGA